MSSYSCPKCGGDTKVLDSGASAGASGIRRRRRCDSCQHRFSSYETELAEAPQFLPQIEALMAKGAVVSESISTFTADLERLVHMVRIFREIQDANARRPTG